MPTAFFRAGAIALATAMVACRESAPPTTPDEFISRHGPGMDAAVLAADNADKAYTIIADTPVTKLRDDPALRAKVGALVTEARDAYRRASSYEIAHCDKQPPYDPPILIGGTIFDTEAAASVGGDKKAVRARLSGRSIELVTYKASGTWKTTIFLLSSRGKVILNPPTCGHPWRGYNSTIGANSPDSSTYDWNANQIGNGFAKLLIGDAVDIDNVIVDIKR